MRRIKNKKGLIFLFCVLLLGITFGGVVAGKDQGQEDINLTEINQEASKDDEYFQYISGQATSAIKEYYGFSDCDIHISCSNGEISSVDVHILAENKDIDDVEADIKAYISECFNIPMEYIVVKKNSE